VGDRQADLLSTSDLGQLLNETSLDEVLLNETLLIEALLTEISLDEVLLNETLLIEALLTETSPDEVLLNETLLIEALLNEALLTKVLLNESLLIETLLTETSLDQAALLNETLLTETVLNERLESFNGRTVRTDNELAGREPLRLVERASLSVPRTTRLRVLLGVFRSTCITSARNKNPLAGHEKEEGNPEAGEHTVTTKLKVQIISYFYVNDTQKALISSLELALIEYLSCDNGRIVYHTDNIEN
jgi:hypothetical protein